MSTGRGREWEAAQQLTNYRWPDTSAHRRYRDGGAWGSSHGNSSAITAYAATAMGIPGYPLGTYTGGKLPKIAEGMLTAIAASPGAEEPLFHGFQNVRGAVFKAGDTLRLPLTATSGDLSHSAGYGIRLDVSDQQGPPTVLAFPPGTPMVAYGKWSDDREVEKNEFGHVYSEAIVAGAYRVTSVQTVRMSHGQHDRKNKTHHPYQNLTVVSVEATGHYDPTTKRWVTRG